MVNIATAILTDHAMDEMRRRGVTELMVREVLTNPGQVHDVRPGRVVAQSRFVVSESECIVRVFVDIDREPAEVVTAYISSKVRKYWRETA